MTTEKYSLCETARATPNGTALFRVVALRDIPAHGVRRGELGGLVASARNLTQIADAWVSGDA